MSEGKAPLRDGHSRKMSPHPSTLCVEDVFKCAAMDCGRYYARRYGYFSVAPGLSTTAWCAKTRTAI
jgi:hypothetical protein